MVSEPLNNTALYLRLSRENDAAFESESIRSQQMLLTDYAYAHGFHVSAIFSDDGISGTTSERPAFQEMLRAVEQGWIRTVLVKDLSRLSRDYLQTGELLEKWFPTHHARLISVCDGVDTGRQLAANDFTPFRAVMDDFYTPQRNGICTSATLPYGYQRVDGTVQIDSEKATNVRKIYALYRNGASMCEIARVLNSRRIPPPDCRNLQWSDAGVRRILTNPVYCGQMMLHKTEKCSYKSKQRRKLPMQEQIPCNVPSIVSEETVSAVQKLLYQRRHERRSVHWLSGRVCCLECGSRMTVSGPT